VMRKVGENHTVPDSRIGQHLQNAHDPPPHPPVSFQQVHQLGVCALPCCCTRRTHSLMTDSWSWTHSKLLRNSGAFSSTVFPIQWVPATASIFRKPSPGRSSTNTLSRRQSQQADLVVFPVNP
jgi:hypothetical protein